MDTVDPATRSRIMSRVKSRGNGTTEVPMAKSMRAAGATGWRRHVRIRIRSGHASPDFVFPRERLAVMVHGCFWHCCPSHGSIPKSNLEFWREKLSRNRSRDRRNVRGLREAGWEVICIWEHSVKKDPGACAERVLRVLVRLREAELDAGGGTR